MPKTIPVHGRIREETAAKLDELARTTRRSTSDLVGEANEAYPELNAGQVERIRRSLEEARSGAPGVPHAEVEAWVRSWDTGNELPRPEPKR